MPLFNKKEGEHTIQLGWKLVEIKRAEGSTQDTLILKFDDVIWGFPMTMLTQFFLHEYEHLERFVAHAMYGEGDIVLEAGGGSGVVGLTIRRTGAKLITYEPREEHCWLMRDIFNLNNFEDPIIIVAAIASQSGVVTLITDKIWWDATIIDQNHLTRPTDSREVPCVGVNEALQEHKANALHLDVEGAELNIFSALDFSLVNKISLEVHPSMIGEKSYDDIIVPKLVDAGFQLKAQAGMDRNYPTHNFVVG